MSDRKSIKLFYITNIVSSCLGGIGGLAMLALLSQTNYGLYTLFTTFVLQFAILSFGYPDGLLIDYREDDGNVNIRSVFKDLKYIIKFQFLVIISSLIGFNLLNYFLLHFNQDLTMIINMALITMIPALLIENLRSIYISLKDFNNVAKVDAFNKSYLVLMIIPIVLFFNSPYLIFIFMLSDIIFRSSFCTYLITNFYNKHKSTLKEYEDENDLKPQRHFKKGIFLLFGNWLVVLIYSLDKMFLTDNKEALGLYTQALFFFGIIYQLVMPFKDVIFVKINEGMKDKEVFDLAITLMSVLFLLVMIFSYIIVPGGMYLCDVIENYNIHVFDLTQIAQKFKEYSNAMDISKTVVVLVPTYITVQLVLDNLLMIKMQSRYAFKTLINFIITLAIFIICKNTFSDGLEAVITAVIIMSVTLFFNNMLSVTNLSYGIKGLVYIILIMILYFIGLIKFYLALPCLLIMIIIFRKVKKTINKVNFNR